MNISLSRKKHIIILVVQHGLLISTEIGNVMLENKDYKENYFKFLLFPHHVLRIYTKDTAIIKMNEKYIKYKSFRGNRSINYG